MLTINQIKEFESIYTRNMDQALYWDEQITKACAHDEWMNTIHQRSLALHHMYLENQNQIELLFKEMDEGMSEEVMEELTNLLIRLFYGDHYDDALIMTRMVDALLPHYETIKDVHNIIELLHIKSNLYTEYYYRQSAHVEEYSYQDIHGKLYQYNSYYSSLPKEDRRILILNTYNITCVLSLILPHEVNEIFDLYCDFINRMNQEDIVALDASVPELQQWRRNLNIEIWNIAEVIEYFDEEHLLKFYEMISQTYHKEQEPSNNLVSAYYYTCAYVQEHLNITTGITWVSAFQKLKQDAGVLLEKLEQHEITIIDEEFLVEYYYPFQEAAYYVFYIYRNLNQAMYRESMKEFIQKGTNMLGKLPKGGRVWLIYAFHSEWCEFALGVLDDFEEQLHLLNNFVVKGQIQTYIHSQMVALLAKVILKEVIIQKPDLLLNIPKLTTYEDLQEHKEELLTYIEQAAMLHDIGKSKISSVINQQMRKISNEEFQLIKQHPKHPEQGILKYTKGFTQFYDIITGHHKSYDGKRGYPEYFDNTHSPIRVLIDLITICDAIDAATDRLGRNYATGKEFHEVLQELIDGKATQYNPDLVELIESDASLCETIHRIVDQGRYEVYYHTYQEYFV